MRVWWGAVAQLGERLVRNEEVSGSIPLSSTKKQHLGSTYGRVRKGETLWVWPYYASNFDGRLSVGCGEVGSLVRH